MQQVLRDVLDTPISPELLRPSAAGDIQQRTEDIVGPYELHDFFLYHLLRFGSGPRRVARLCLHGFGDTVPDRRDPPVAAAVPGALLRQSVQARLRSRRPQGGLGRLAVAARRLAHAGRRLRRRLARGGREIPEAPKTPA